MASWHSLVGAASAAPRGRRRGPDRVGPLGPDRADWTSPVRLDRPTPTPQLSTYRHMTTPTSIHYDTTQHLTLRIYAYTFNIPYQYRRTIQYGKLTEHDTYMTSDNTSHYLLVYNQLNSNQFKDNLQSISTQKQRQRTGLASRKR